MREPRTYRNACWALALVLFLVWIFLLASGCQVTCYQACVAQGEPGQRIAIVRVDNDALHALLVDENGAWVCPFTGRFYTKPAQLLVILDDDHCQGGSSGRSP